MFEFRDFTGVVGLASGSPDRLRECIGGSFAQDMSAGLEGVVSIDGPVVDVLSLSGELPKALR